MQKSPGILLIALALALEPGSASAYGPCEVVSAADAGRLLAAQVRVSEGPTSDGGRACFYDTGRPSRSIQVTLYEALSEKQASLQFSAEIATLAGVYVEPPLALKGLGDEAVAFAHVLWVRTGRRIIVINVIDDRVRGNTLAEAKQLAVKALMRH